MTTWKRSIFSMRMMFTFETTSSTAEFRINKIGGEWFDDQVEDDHHQAEGEEWQCHKGLSMSIANAEAIGHSQGYDIEDDGKRAEDEEQLSRQRRPNISGHPEEKRHINNVGPIDHACDVGRRPSKTHHMKHRHHGKWNAK